uniref:Uncharacterized protein n=1 Tax=Arundo donax TaxID=35708 RepID=A0A0A8YCF6_ARUDO
MKIVLGWENLTSIRSGDQFPVK